MEAGDHRRWRIGELAEATGLSVRALRHYDELGLLTPAERSSAGYRLYDDAELCRLYRIVALRKLGLPLREVRKVLNGDELTLTETARRHLEQIDRQLAALAEQRERVARILEARASHLSGGELISAIEGTTMNIRLDRIYTRQGDDGWTNLADGTRVPKSDPLLAPDLEELNAQLGVALTLPGLDEHHGDVLRRIQNDLFDIGAGFTVREPEREHQGPNVTSDSVAWLEEVCDEANARLQPLGSFVLPGGSPIAAQLHVCRTVCRRLEREAAGVGGVHPEVLRYLNRLSDLLFIFARAAASDDERVWQPAR